MLMTDRVFTHALSTIKRIPRTSSARPPSAERLKLYGLYKQSMEGDVRGVMSRPTSSDKGEVEKWLVPMKLRFLQEKKAKWGKLVW